MKVKNFLSDILGIVRIIYRRNKAYKNAPGDKIPSDPIAKTAKALHPGKIKATIVRIEEEKADSKRICFHSEELPLFLSGTYLTVELSIDDSILTRPYSIVSEPHSSYKKKEVEIIVKERKEGVVSSYLCNKAKVGDEVTLEVGLGDFHYTPFRDSRHIVAIAGGVGITPFLSMAKDIVDNDLDLNLTILYGSVDSKGIIAEEELNSLVGDKVKVIHVISGDEAYQGEKGFIDEAIIKKYSPVEATYFLCGPKKMIESVMKELSKMNVDTRKVRYESFPIEDISSCKGYDASIKNKAFDIEVRIGHSINHIKAKAKESIATALERAGIKIHTCCRCGKCGACRIKVIEGNYFIPKENDHRREADKEFNYVYSCSTYPISDLIIKIDAI